MPSPGGTAALRHAETGEMSLSGRPQGAETGANEVSRDLWAELLDDLLIPTGQGQAARGRQQQQQQQQQSQSLGTRTVGERQPGAFSSGS
ncbi:unnamed protein product [Gadus morhua 'NCC']